MESIVSPWFVYLVSIVNVLIGLSAGFAVITGAASLAYIITNMTLRGGGSGQDKEEWKRGWGKVGGLVITLTIVFILSATFIPSKNALIAMYVANEVTYNSVEKAGNITREIKNELKGDVMDILNLFIENKEIKTNIQQPKQGGEI